jgi:hypothetical protein
MGRNFYFLYFKIFTVLIFSCFVFSFPVFGQGNKTVSGIIIDAGTKNPVEFATVALQNQEGKILDGATCDNQGNFSIQKVAPGNYNLSVSFIGYQTRTQAISVPEAAAGLKIGKIELSLDNKALKEVVVSAAKPMIEETDDGFVYDAENDLNAAGGNASDLLKNVPGLTVDLDGNLEMQGSTKIKVLIDGKPSAIMAGNVAEALQQIPANMIQKVEVITTPSAKYDAEGTGGIINIITKKNTTLQGYRGGVNATGGNRANSVNANLTSRVGKVGLRGSLGGNLNRNFGNGENEQVYYEQRQVTQNSEFQNDGQGLNGLIGTDLDFNPNNSLSATVRLSQYGSANDRFNTTLVTSTLPATFGNIISNDRNTTDSKSSNSTLDTNLDYTRKYKTKGQELNILMLYSRSQRDGDNYTVRENKEGNVSNRQQNNNDAANDELTLQADYTHPFKKYGRLEVGTKAILRNNQSNYQLAAATSAAAPLVIDPRRTNIFTYDQDVYAAYLSYSLQIKKIYNLRLGGRYEYTNIFADFVTNDTTLTKPYKSFMPNITGSVRLKKNQRLSLNYSTRIFRPQIEYLNPYRDDANERSIRVGNPELLPELTHNLQLTYSKYVKTTSLNGSLYWRQTNDDIGQYRTSARVRSRNADNDTNIANDSIDAITTTYLNLGNNLTYGTNLSLTGRIFKMGQLGGNFSFYYNEINGYTYNTKLKASLPVSVGGWMYNLKLNAGFKIPKEVEGPFKEMSAQVATSINSPRLNLQGKSSSFQQYSISLRKEFLVRRASKDRANINFSIENFFNRGNQIRTTTVTEQFTTASIQNHYNRVYRLGFGYNFSRMEYKIKPEKERKSIVNDDRQKMDIGEVKEIKMDGSENGRKENQKPASKNKNPAKKPNP